MKEVSLSRFLREAGIPDFQSILEDSLDWLRSVREDAELEALEEEMSDTEVEYRGYEAEEEARYAWRGHTGMRSMPP